MLDILFKVSIIVDLVDKLSSPLINVKKQVESLEAANEVFRNTGKGLMALSGAAIFFGRDFVTASADMESYKMQLTTMLGDQGKAVSRLKEYAKIAALTPFELPEVINAGNQLQALGRYSKDNLFILGDLASAANKPFDQAMRAYAKLASGQKGIAVDMFRDLLITTQDWVNYTGKGVSKSGEILATTEEMLSVLPRILKDKGFIGMMANQAKTFKGVLSNFKDSIYQFQAAFGEGLLSPLKKVFQTITSVINKMVEWADKHPFLAKMVSRLAGTVLFLSFTVGALLFLYGSFGTLKTALSGNLSAMGQSFSMLTKKIWTNITATKVMQATLDRMKYAKVVGLSQTKIFSEGIGIFLKTLTGNMKNGLKIVSTEAGSFSKILTGGMAQGLLRIIPLIWSFNIALFTCPVTWIILLIAAAVAILVTGTLMIIKNWNTLKGTFERALKPAIDMVKTLTANLQYLAKALGLNALFSGIKKLFAGLKIDFSGTLDFLAEGLGLFMGIFVGSLTRVINLLTAYINTGIGTIITGITNLVKLIKGEINFKEFTANMADHFKTIGNNWKTAFSFKFGSSNDEKALNQRLELVKKTNDLTGKTQVLSAITKPVILPKVTGTVTPVYQTGTGNNTAVAAKANSTVKESANRPVIYQITINELKIDGQDIKNIADFIKSLSSAVQIKLQGQLS